MLFYIKKANKIFIRITYNNNTDAILLFDTKNGNYHFTEELQPIMTSFGYDDMARHRQGTISYSMKEDVLYAVCRIKELDEDQQLTIKAIDFRGSVCWCWTEVRTWRCENGEFAEIGTKWKSPAEKQDSSFFPEIYSAVFV